MKRGNDPFQQRLVSSLCELILQSASSLAWELLSYLLVGKALTIYSENWVLSRQPLSFSGVLRMRNVLHVARFYVSSKEADGIDFEHLPYCSGVGLPKLDYQLFIQRDFVIPSTVQ